MAVADSTVIWRLPLFARIPAVLGFGALAVVGLVFGVTAPTNPVPWIIFVVGAFNLAGEWRRACRLTDTELLAQGRFARRAVTLSDLAQVGTGIGGRVWVQTHHPLDKRGGTYLYLRMIPPAAGVLVAGAPGGQNAVQIIRARAMKAGAQLDEPLPDVHTPRSKKPLIFSI